MKFRKIFQKVTAKFTFRHTGPEDLQDEIRPENKESSTLPGYFNEAREKSLKEALKKGCGLDFDLNN